MKNSLFRKYFMICSMCVLASIIGLGGVLMVFAARYFENDKFQLLERSVRQAAYITGQTFRSTGQVDGKYQGVFQKEVITLIYSSLSTSIDGEFWLTDINGQLLYFTENGADHNFTDEELQNFTISPSATQKATSGLYREKNTLGGLYKTKQYVVAVPVPVQMKSAQGEVQSVDMGVLYIVSSTRGLRVFLLSLLEMFIISASVVIILAFVLIYFITSGMVRPLKLMLSATHSFSRGDFTVRVPVSGYDEIGQLSMAFNNMASTLATTESSRRSFVANVSHELKTPMTTIGGFVDGILDGTIPTEKHDQYLTVVSNEVKRLSRLVHSMLDTARIETGELQVKPTTFDISELNRQTIFTFEQTLEEKQLNIAGLEIDQIFIHADSDLMHQVVYNLIENAVKFVDVGGTISFSYSEDDNMIWTSIRNTGSGLDKEEVPRLFDRFYKSDKSRSLNKNGVGLGLHIVRSIVNYHDGEVVVRSEKGMYTEFSFGIPKPSKKSGAIPK